MNIKFFSKESMSRQLVMAVILLLASLSAFAESNQLRSATNTSMQPESGVVSGKVTDESGNVLAGVTVMIKGANTGTVTDANGVYQLQSTKAGQTLVFSFIGMKQKEVAIGNQLVINVVMAEETTLLNEVVAVGYGIQQKRDITGSVSSVKSENFNKGVINSAEQLIQGKVSGVNITSSSGAPGAGQRIIIRGQSSLRENTGPLFVIDGFPVGLGGTGTDDSNPFGFINPDDIESIDVLKDASAAAIYGTRGANGVIMITTKSGKAGSTQLSISSKVGMSTIAKKLPVFSADEFRTNVTAIGGNLIDRGGNTDWQDVLTTTAITNDHSLTMQGGTNNFTFRASAGYLNQEGIVINTGIERYTANLKANQKLIGGKLNIDYGVNASVEKGENSDASSLVSDMLSFNPTYTAKDELGNPIDYTDLNNPLMKADVYTTFSEKRRLSANISPSIELFKGFTYKLNFVYENTGNQTDYQAKASEAIGEDGYLTQFNHKSTNTLIENYFNYNWKNDVHNFSVMAGHSYQESFYRESYWTIKDFTESDGLEPRNTIETGKILTSSEWPLSNAYTTKLQSFFGRLNYSLYDKYLLTATLRADGSSKFGANNRYGIFPSFAAGWRISEEQFLKDNAIISNLKLRAGWGQTGNQEIPVKQTKASYNTIVSSSTSYPLYQTGSYFAGIQYNRLPNEDLQWEVTNQSNLGLDFGLFNGTLSGSFDYYNKVTNNILLIIPPGDPIQVTNTVWDNIDDMTITNNGWELALNYNFNKLKDFRFSVGGTFSHVENVVKNSPYTILTTGSASGSGLTGATINGLINGYPVGSFYMKTFTGIGSDGLSTYANDGELSVVGCALPDFTYGINLNAEYKRFDLSANFNGVSGNEIYNNTAMNKFYKAQLANSSNTTAIATEYANESLTNAGAVSTRYLEDGSYLRLNNLSLGYSFDTKKIGVSNWLKDMRLSLSGQNLFVITKYSGFDPEVNQNRSMNGFQSFGIDLNGYPTARTFTVGLNLTFN
ncbi:MAG: TonB-dependent receptor SusC [Bacteroidetes bacterium]|nr:TonB-dependent receptor SusC [Bacteroidota bacterium]